MWQNMNAKQSNKDKICVYSQFFTAMARFPHDSWNFFCDHSQKQPALVMIGIVNKAPPSPKNTQSNLFNTDTKGTEPSVCFTEVSVL